MLVLIPLSLAFQFLFAIILASGTVTLKFKVEILYSLIYKFFSETCCLKVLFRKNKGLYLKTASAITALVVTLINMFISGFMESNAI